MDDDAAAGHERAPAERLATSIRRLRTEAGLSQKQLASMIGYTREYLSAAERVGGNLPSLTLVRALDGVLQADGVLLQLWTQARNDRRARRDAATGARSAEKLVEASAHTWVTRGLDDRRAPVLNDLRRAVFGRYELPDGQPDGPSLVAGVNAGVGKVHRLYQLADYDGAARLLPQIISRAKAAQGSVPASTMTAAYLAAAKLASKVGDPGLTWVSADRCLHLAIEAEQPGLLGTATYQVAQALLRDGHIPDAEHTAGSAVEQLASVPGRAGGKDTVSARGALLLLMAVMAARRGDAAAARNSLQHAAELADQLGDGDNRLWTAFGPTNVAIHKLSVHVALGDSRAALQLGDSLDVEALPVTLCGRRSQVHIELGWAAASQGDDSVAVLHLLEAERVASQAVSHHATARRLLHTLVSRERKNATPGLRALATRAGVP